MLLLRKLLNHYQWMKPESASSFTGLISHFSQIQLMQSATESQGLLIDSRSVQVNIFHLFLSFTGILILLVLFLLVFVSGQCHQSYTLLLYRVSYCSIVCMIEQQCTLWGTFTKWFCMILLLSCKTTEVCTIFWDIVVSDSVHHCYCAVVHTIDDMGKTPKMWGFSYCCRLIAT